ncbi:MAG: M64 family metallo-endopeptidase [Bacteroidia bacterium]|nr:M64 family metallo-endopeptidase [Bacteroidia bacterium]
MKKLLIRIIILFVPLSGWATPVFDDFFTDEVLRYDYLLTGNHTSVAVIPCEIKKEKMWSGSHNTLIDNRNLGTYRFRVYDNKSGELIFSKGFSPLFQEWQTTAEAKVIDKAFYQVIRFPFPKNIIRLKIEKRNYDGQFSEIYSTNINPENYFINNENTKHISVEKILISGEPSHKIDIAILAEGYTEDEMEKFVKDSKRLTDSLFVVAPFSQMKEYFNVYTLKTPSVESGTDIPGEHIYRNSLFNSTFYTFDISRYLTTSDMKTIHDMAAAVPYDQIIILVNSSRYGGGGFYNSVTVCTTDHLLSSKVFAHEFGHGFGGLGDEYYTSEVAYDNYYNLKVEPWEPNLTTLVDFSSKWKDMVDVTTPVPTPRDGKYASKVGAFEGGGYISKGMFSPRENCRMKSNETSEFCQVCQKAIKEAIIENTK